MTSHKNTLHQYAARKRATLGRTNSAFVGRRVQIVVATIIAPWAIVPAVALWIFLVELGAAYEVLVGERYFLESLFQYFSFVGIWTIVGVTIAYPATVLIGIPTHILLVLLKFERLVAYLLAGSVGGFLISLLTKTGLGSTLFLVCCGALVAVVFWAIVKR